MKKVFEVNHMKVGSRGLLGKKNGTIRLVVLKKNGEVKVVRENAICCPWI